MGVHHPPPLSNSGADGDRARRRWLREREGAEMARAAAALRAAAARLPPDSRIGRDLAAWARRLAFAAEVHRLVEPPESERRTGD
jgi:hypothetical protein